MASVQFIDIEKNFPGLKDKISGFTTDMAIWAVDDECSFAVNLLIETDTGFEWKEISECVKKGTPREKASVTKLKVVKPKKAKAKEDETE